MSYPREGDLAIRRSSALLAILLGLAVAWPAQAEDRPKYERRGVILGFNLGVGTAGLDAEGVSGRETGGGGNLRFGFALEPDFSVSLEAALWTSQVGDVTWAFSVYSPTATWYPGGKSFFLRGGLGWGRIEAEQGGLSRTEDGLGALAAIGYEWRLTRRFALAPQLDAQWLDVGSGIRGNFFNLTLGFSWYL